MKKLFFIAVVSAFSATAVAQTTFGVQVGANMANSKVEYTEPGLGTIEQDNKSKVGFLIGAVAEVPFSSSISFRPELNFIQKGFKFDESIGGASYTEEVTLNYLELPLNFVYTVPAGTGNVFFGLGPNFGFGLSGKYKTTETGEPNTSTDIKFDGEKNETSTDGKFHLKAFDFGGNVLAGYKMSNGLFFSLGYTVGFADISPDDALSYKNNSGLALKVGFNFGGSKAKAE